jgi:hypothetical protein
MARREAIETALTECRDAERRLAGALDGGAEAASRDVKLHRDEFQALSSAHMAEWMGKLAEAEWRSCFHWGLGRVRGRRRLRPRLEATPDLLSPIGAGLDRMTRILQSTGQESVGVERARVQPGGVTARSKIGA